MKARSIQNIGDVSDLWGTSHVGRFVIDDRHTLIVAKSDNVFRVRMFWDDNAVSYRKIKEASPDRELVFSRHKRFPNASWMDMRETRETVVQSVLYYLSPSLVAEPIESTEVSNQPGGQDPMARVNRKLVEVTVIDQRNEEVLFNQQVQFDYSLDQRGMQLELALNDEARAAIYPDGITQDDLSWHFREMNDYYIVVPDAE